MIYDMYTQMVWEKTVTLLFLGFMGNIPKWSKNCFK